MTCLLTAFLAGLAAMSRRPWLALLPATTALVVAIAWGGILVPGAPWAGGGYFLFALLWCALVTTSATKARSRRVQLAGVSKKNTITRPLVIMALTLSVCLVAGTLAGVSERGNREVLRLSLIHI